MITCWRLLSNPAENFHSQKIVNKKQLLWMRDDCGSVMGCELKWFGIGTAALSPCCFMSCRKFRADNGREFLKILFSCYTYLNPVLFEVLIDVWCWLSS